MTTIELGMPGAGTLGVPHLLEDDVAQNKKDFASDMEPRWCAGCGDYSILAAVRTHILEVATIRRKGRRSAVEISPARRGPRALSRDTR